MTGAGARGMGPLRALLEWTPVQAHATAHKVTLIYACASPASAAFLADWDTWREAGVRTSGSPFKSCSTLSFISQNARSELHRTLTPISKVFHNVQSKSQLDRNQATVRLVGRKTSPCCLLPLMAFGQQRLLSSELTSGTDNLSSEFLYSHAMAVKLYPFLQIDVRPVYMSNSPDDTAISPEKDLKAMQVVARISLSILLLPSIFAYPVEKYLPGLSCFQKSMSSPPFEYCISCVPFQRIALYHLQIHKAERTEKILPCIIFWPRLDH